MPSCSSQKFIQRNFRLDIPFLKLTHFIAQPYYVPPSYSSVLDNLMSKSDERMLSRLLRDCRLEEVWFDVSLPNFVEALERQRGLVNLTMTGPDITDLSKFDNLAKLIVKGLTESMVDQINSHGKALQLLKLSGPADLIDRVNMDSLPTINRFTAELSSPPSEEALQRRAQRNSRSALEGVTSIALALNASWTNTSLATYLCSFNRGQIQSLTVSDITSSNFLLPSCIEGWSSLYSLTIGGLVRPNFAAYPTTVNKLKLYTLTGPPIILDWSAVARLSNLSEIYFSLSGVNIRFPPNTTIQSITILDSLTGEIPETFFLQSPKLSYLFIQAPQVIGKLPSIGWKNMKTLICLQCGVTGWGPSLNYSTAIPGNGPPLLLYDVEFVGCPNLVVIPDETSLAAMEKLGALRFTSSPLLSGLLPLYNNPDMFEHIFIYNVPGCNFSGPLPNMPSFSLIASSVAVSFDVSGNTLLSGTVPQSWSRFPFGTINMRGLHNIKGAWPDMFQFAKRSGATTVLPTGVYLSTIDLTNTSIIGSLGLNTNDFSPSFFPGPSKPYLYFDHAALDFCSATANFSAWKMPLSACIMTNTNANRCPERYIASGCTMSSFFAAACPPPRPSPDFYCKSGTWTSNTSVCTCLHKPSQRADRHRRKLDLFYRHF